MTNMNRWKLASFDLDGTLSRGISTGQHLANKIGHSKKMAEMELRYERGEASNYDVAKRDAIYYQGLAFNDIESYLEDLPMLGDVLDTIDHLTKQGIPSVLCTIAWSDVAKAISGRFGFVDWSGPVLELDRFSRYTGKVSKHFESEDKVRFVEEICARDGFTMADVFHVGDSRSDIELFQKVGFSLALNGTEQANEAANTSIATESLLEILTVIPN